MARREPQERRLEFDDANALRELAGEVGVHLQDVGRDLGVRITQRGSTLTILGFDGSVDLAVAVLEQLYELVRRGTVLSVGLVEQSTRLIRQDPTVRLDQVFNDVVFVGRKRNPIFPRSVRQKAYVEAMRQNELVFGIGPAGTGKTFLAVTMAVAALSRNEVSKLVLCRPAVEAGEKLGFLPGDLVDKVNPYLQPLMDALNELLGHDKVIRLRERGVIEVAPLAFMRGRTLADAYVILDEAQNTTSGQMKMLLTRLGEGSRCVVTGDLSQVDLPRGVTSGLREARAVLGDIRGIEMVEFTPDDVMRHRLVSSIIRAYDRARPRDGGS